MDWWVDLLKEEGFHFYNESRRIKSINLIWRIINKTKENKKEILKKSNIIGLLVCFKVCGLFAIIEKKKKKRKKRINYKDNSFNIKYKLK